MGNDKLLTVNEVKDYLGVSRPTVYKLMDEGELKFFLVGQRRRISMKEVERYLERQEGNQSFDREGWATPCVAIS